MQASATVLRDRFLNQFWLLTMLTVREIHARYKGSILGVFWSFLTPVSMLLVYTFVFGVVFQSRWPAPEGDTGGLALYALVLFAGLITFQCFADVVTRAPALILSNRNYVTRVVFPLHLLPVVQLGAAAFQYLVSLAVLLIGAWITLGEISLHALWMPVILLPLGLLISGLAWYFAGLGAYYRDLAQVLGTVVSAMMFLAPIFYARSVLPKSMQDWILLNPLTVPVEQTREVLIYGHPPNFEHLMIYTLISAAVAVGGFWSFSRRRKGFADVI